MSCSSLLDLRRDAGAIRRQAHVGVGPRRRVDWIFPPLSIDPDQVPRRSARAAAHEIHQRAVMRDIELGDAGRQCDDLRHDDAAPPSRLARTGSNAIAQSAPPAT